MNSVLTNNDLTNGIREGDCLKLLPTLPAGIACTPFLYFLTVIFP